MEFYETINARYSVRKYSDKKVEQDKIERIAKVANAAPSAKNTNGVKVYAVTNGDMLEKLKDVSPCTFGAPLLFVVCSDENLSWKNAKGNSRGVMDASITADEIMLSAVNEGLGTCWVCMFDEDKMKKVLDMPENIVPQCIIVCGYAADDCVPNERHTIRTERFTYVR